MDFFEYLKGELTKRGWTIPQFAQRAEVTDQLAYKWLSENPRYRVTPGPMSCRKVAAAFGVTEDEVLTAAGHRSAPQSAETPRTQVPYVQRLRELEQQSERIREVIGPDAQQMFWDMLKAQGDTLEGALRKMAVIQPADGADNALVSRPKDARGGRRRPDKSVFTSTPFRVNALAGAAGI